MEIKQRAAIVTGASSGIGTAIARTLDAAGMALILTARRGERLRQLQTELRNAESIAGDLLDEALLPRLFEVAEERYGGCDVFINNAGTMVTGTIDDLDLERMTEMLRVNVEASFRACYLALRHFRKRGAGHLINVSSVLGTKTRPTAGAYSGTKYALEALSQALRLELAGSSIFVTCIEPGLVMTELHNQMPVHPSKALNIERPLQPEDIARAVRFVLDQPSHVLVSNLMVLPGESPL